MRIWLSTAPLAFRLKGAGDGTVDNRNQRQGLHLRNPETCPNKPGHLCVQVTIIDQMLRHPSTLHNQTRLKSICQ